MMLLSIILILVAVVVVTTFVTQILLPTINGTPWFPLFRNSSTKKALSDLEDKLEEAAEIADIQNRLNSVAEKVQSKMNGKFK